MPHAIQRRRGTTEEHAAFTGLSGEVTIDTDKNVPVVHDGVTAGGHPAAREDHNHDTTYAPLAHAHPEVVADLEEVIEGVSQKLVPVGLLAEATVKSASVAVNATHADSATVASEAGNSTKLNGRFASATPVGNTIPIAGPDGKLDSGWLPGSGNIDAATLSGKSASLTKAPNSVPATNANGDLDDSWFGGNVGAPAGYAQYLTPGSYSFTVPDGVTAVFVEVHGGGAGGGGNVNAGGTGGTSSFGAYASATGGASGNGSADLGSNGSTVGCPVLLRPKFVNNDGAANPGTGRRGGAGSNYGSGGYRAQGSTSEGGAVGTGGRGAGGGASTSGTSGGAGGNGIALVTGLTPGAVIPVTVGAGGSGGVKGVYVGAAGGAGFVRVWW